MVDARYGAPSGDWIVAWILIVIGLFAVASSGSEVGPIQTP